MLPYLLDVLWPTPDHFPIFRNEWSQLIIISKINSSWDSLTCQSRDVWTVRRRYLFLQRSIFSYKLFTNIVTRFVAAIQSFYLYLVDRNCLNPTVFLLITLFLSWKHFWKTVCYMSLSNLNSFLHPLHKSLSVEPGS